MNRRRFEKNFWLVVFILGVPALLVLQQFFSGAGPGRAVEGALNARFSLSPDGRTLVFAGVGNGGRDLYLLHLDGLWVTRLTNTPTFEAYPAFSPDGNSIVYQGAATLYAPRYLFLRSLDGTHVRPLTAGTHVRPLTAGTRTCDLNPSFSRDGRRIVFGRAHKDHPEATNEDPWTDLDVYVVNRDGTHLKRLTHHDYGGDIRPKFFPDGASVLFEESLEGTNYDVSGHLARIDVAGAGPIREVAVFGQNDADADFFPDGRQIVFVSDMDADGLYRMRLDGSRPVGLSATDAGRQIHNPVVSPDGRTIYYLQGYGSDLWRLDLDTNTAHRIAGGDLFTDPLHWRPARH